MDKNLIKAIIISFIVVILWEKMGFFKTRTNRPLPAPRIEQKIESDKLKKSLPSEEVVVKPAPKETFKEVTETLPSPAAEVVLTNKGAGIQSIYLKKYDYTIDFTNTSFSPLTLVRLGNIKGLEQVPFDIQKLEDSVNLRTKINSNIELSVFITPDRYDYLYKMKVIVKNNGAQEIYFPDGLELVSGNLKLQKDKPYSSLSYTRYTIENETENIKYKKIDDKRTVDEIFHWAGVQNTTYCSILKESDFLRKVTWIRNSPEQISATVSTSDFTLPQGQEKVFSFNYYLGPKLYFHLKEINMDFEKVIDYGALLGPITKTLVLFLNYLFRLTKNYGIAIILMTVIFKILTFPLTQKSMVSMKAMQKLQPQIKQLQTQHKNNPTLMQKEMMQLYKKHKINPLSGCLPMLIQLPIFIAFYKAIANSVELQGASFLLIKDLAAPDQLISLNSFNINILPLLMGAIQFISSKQTTTDPSQKSMLYFFPVFMTVIFYKMPSALVLYFLVSTLIGIIQNYFIKLPEKKRV